MNGLLWLLVPGAPLLAGMLLVCAGPRRCASWLWLSCLPALALCLWPAEPLALPALWPGAQWAADDPLSRAWLGFSALLWACASRFAVTDMAHDDRQQRFWIFWLLALLGNLLLVIAGDAGSFYAGFTLMSLSAYALVAHQRGPAPRQAGRLYLQLAVLGEMLIYAGMLMRIHEAGGALALEVWRETPIGTWSAALLLVGFGLKAGFWPLHVWLPLAHPAAPAAASAVLSGAMIKAGILGLWQFLPAEDPLLREWTPWLLAAGAISALYGVALGLLQTRSKALLAYSSISQVGYLLIILALAWQQPGYREAAAVLLALYAVHHGLAKGALFMGAGLSTRGRLRAWHWLCLALPALALAGLPLTSGAAVKLLLKDGIEAGHLAGWMLLLVLGSTGTMLLMLRLLWLMRASQRQTSLPPLVAGQSMPWLLLCLMPVALPWAWPPLRQAMLDSLPLYAIWAALWPALLALAISGLVWKMGWQLPTRLQHLPNPARVLSLRLMRLLQRPLLPELGKSMDEQRWRRSERHWNRLWHAGTVATSAWIIVLLLMLGWLG
ncbi:proton-conducting transporter membrane subunit [Pseudomonas sp. MYb185]|uniref:proton-conducting transporter transmembrane domain-containing protein n=1 Tax=Pseudomonas sp. MYb185 TaxID=1848729 RepID=UPI000CFCE934|nr:proton-conducting transporter membrane subunit [Pseudomonas sp. MYb185]PRB80450.1 sodium:proton antiporter [Pseudomonas sp. MYb185]